MREKIYNHYDLMEYYKENICPHCYWWEQCSEQMGDSPSTIYKFMGCHFNPMGDMGDPDIRDCKDAILEYIDYEEETGL